MKHRSPIGAIVGILIVAFAISVCATVQALSDPILHVEVESVVTTPTETDVTFQLIMNATEDTIIGFEIVLLSSDPFVLQFDNTTVVDTNSTPISGWDFVESTIFGNPAGYMKVVGIQNLPEPPGTPTPIYASAKPMPLFRFNMKVFTDQPDTLCDFSGLVMIEPNTTKFANRFGENVGWVVFYEIDTTYYNCEQWIGDSCAVWIDTLIDTIPIGTEPDLELIEYINGQYLFSCHLCGDADGSTNVDIDDVVFLITYIFGGGPEPEPLASGDADCSQFIDIDDVVYLISYIFSGGPEPCEECT